ncbi:hypothetical protein H5410_062369, partial [Solanum commersonii]
MCETFNSWIVGPRHKSVISMLEDIRHKMMDRHGDMIKFADTWISGISYMARLILEENKEIGRTLRYFLQLISNMVMWSDTNNPAVEPLEVKLMHGRPGRCRRKYKDEPRKKKWGKASKNGVRMSCFKCHQVGHNKRTCKLVFYTSNSVSLQPFQHPTQQPARPFQQPPVRQPSQPPVRQPSTGHAFSLCADSSKVKGWKKQQPTARATFSSTAWASSTSIVRPKYSSVGRSPTSLVERKRIRDVGFGVYTDIQSERKLINPGRSSERVISSGSWVAFKDASRTNIDLGFKPPGLKWKGKDAMIENQLNNCQRKRSKSKGKW